MNVRFLQQKINNALITYFYIIPQYTSLPGQVHTRKKEVRRVRDFRFREDVIITYLKQHFTATLLKYENQLPLYFNYYVELSSLSISAPSIILQNTSKNKIALNSTNWNLFYYFITLILE